MEARAAVFGLEIFGFCRSWADGSSGDTCFVKIFSDLNEKLRETFGSLWRLVAVPLLKIFFWVLYTKVLRRFLWVNFFVKSCQKL